MENRDSSVGISMAMGWTAEVQLPDGGRDSSLFYNVETAGQPQHPLQKESGVFPWG
jgi:hypothetical protein